MSIEQKKEAIKCFNATWDLIDKQDRTAEENLKMIHMAHASRYHWGEIGTPLEFSRGEWQISRVYCLVNHGESALFHGKHALKYCLDHQIGDFDLAFAYETLARANAVMSDDIKTKYYIEKALEASKDIQKPKDLDYFMSELKTIPGYNL